MINDQLATKIEFDTLKNYKRLIRAGFTESQAQELTYILWEIIYNKQAKKEEQKTIDN